MAEPQSEVSFPQSQALHEEDHARKEDCKHQRCLVLAGMYPNQQELQRTRMQELKWGLVPSWAKDPSTGNTLINASGETVSGNPAFRKAFKHQWCLVLANGFYEWKREGKNTKYPYYIRFKDGWSFVFAGLWERWEKQEWGL